MSRYYNGSGYGIANGLIEVQTMTISVWVKIQEIGTSERTIISYRNQATSGVNRAGFILSVLAGGEIQFTTANNTSAVSVATTASDGLADKVNQWVHILAQTVSGIFRVIYVDGVFKASNNTIISYNSNPTPTLQIGAQIHSNTTVVNQWLGEIHSPLINTVFASNVITDILYTGFAPNSFLVNNNGFGLLYNPDKTINRAFDYSTYSGANVPRVLTQYTDGVFPTQNEPAQTKKYSAARIPRSYSFPTDFIDILNFERSPIRGVARGVS